MIQIGSSVRTSYGTGPFTVTEIHGPCTCPEYVRGLSGDRTPSEQHYHLTCLDERGKQAWLNGYRADGSNVWSKDTLEVLGVAPGQNLDLFPLRN